MTKTHWMTNTIFWKKRQSMKRRCYNKNEVSYKDYGWRWIIVCDRWMKFEWFYEDMYNSYIEYSKTNSQKNTTLDRIDVNWNYELWNCRRATQKQQSNNRRSNHFITIDWETKTQQQRADNVWKNHKSVFYRVRHWIDIFDENKYNESQIEYEWKTQSIAARAREFWMNIQTLWCRLRRWIPMKEAINKKDRRTVLFTRWWRTQTLTEWYTEKWLTKWQFEHRLYKKKLPIEKILNLT